MCSCSGSCNCNSTTIPRGPQGVPGQNGAAATIAVGSVTALPAGSTPTISNGGSSSAAIFNFGIPAGPPGLAGATGSNGISAFTTLEDDFVQPAVNSSNTITVVNNTWMAIDEIIYIGPAPSGLPVEAGGFYQVTAKSGIDGVTIVNLGWTIPGTTFVAPTAAVGAAGTIVTPSGTIGPEGLIRKVLDETSASAEAGSTGAGTAELDWLYSGLTTDQDTLSFEFEIQPNNGNGRFQFVTISVGNVVVSTFSFSGAYAALPAAKINYSFLPTGTTPGYVSSSDEAISEDINFIRGFVRITRNAITGVDVKVEYLMCNKYVQKSYGTSEDTFQVQKHFFGTKRVSGVPNLNSNPLLIEIDATPESMDLASYGAVITIKNAIKLNSIL